MIPPNWPNDRFGLICADPPWAYRDLGHSRRIDRQYSVMTVRDIAALPVPSITLPNAALFLWVPAPLLIPNAQIVIEAWGFTYRSGAMWDKELMAMGHYFRIQHEHLLVATKGRPGIAAKGARNIRSVIRSKRGKHSVKPDAAYIAIERMYPALSKIELFARKRRPGWTSWGNELQGEVSAAAG